MDSPDKKVEEQRVKPTVIRRRAQVTPPPEEIAKPAEASQAKGGIPVKAAAPATASTPGTAGRPGVMPSPVLPEIALTEKEKEDKVRKGPRKKKSKAELELEDIQRAGGLKQYATQTLAPPADDWEPAIERVYEPSLSSAGRRKKSIRREFKKTEVTEVKGAKRMIRVEQAISISELSQAMGIKSSELIKKLMGLGMMVTANQGIDVDTAALLASDYGYEVVHTAFKEDDVLQETQKEKDEGGEKQWRAPVVTVMGHVDHGKTSLLDAIRKTKVVDKEAGGITQHIGAYEVFLPKGSVTFIDTPGHEAFTKLRARGAQVTDIVVLVVAADDGIMPQTIEAINHAKAAGVPIVVAVNKIDKPQAEPEKVKRQLTEHGLVAEEWGGDVVCVGTSAKSGEGLDQLLEMILLTAEVKELKASFTGRAKGVIIESRLDKGRGPVATALVQGGTLRIGEFVVAGMSYGRVRAMVQADGTPVEEAYPSKPIELLGLNSVPEAGEDFFVVEDERDAKRIAEMRQAKKRSAGLIKTSKVSLEELQKQITQGETHELPLLVKADVAGSVEALCESLLRLSTPQVSVKILHSGTGGITESDVMLAHASRAVIIGFSVAPEGKARSLAEHEGIEIRLHSIIYEVLDDVKKAMEGLLNPKITEKFLGRAQVKQAFKVSKIGTIAGCVVSEGAIRRNAMVRLIRDGSIVYQGKIISLKRFKDDAREVTAGIECGIGIENFNDVKEGDMIEAFMMEETAQTLASAQKDAESNAK
ncbi:MAG: translation initiation factor IF-2 [Deltaproteobacteria bacterium]|nr:translation initiation factor IF-2 [Deltaproteobacteria bacterium]